jgi:hypothetical protein
MFPSAGMRIGQLSVEDRSQPTGGMSGAPHATTTPLRHLTAGSLASVEMDLQELD